MNWSSVGVIRKNEMLIVEPGDSEGNFWPNRSATRAIVLPVQQDRALADALEPAGLVQVGRRSHRS